ncbi:hypothetical protein AAGC94_03980 [Clostridium sporogenes]|uniref:hypothetical protein n=1 Tax=Clostridium TaxID=1485 RepID=UPI00024B9ECA|nr:hypothetical protein [Clostridium sporogenes]EHN16342.1 hypothetical protein IYC_04933 [Clostridium sporogenes PA 3679]MBA4507007.1 hypothetical protein [Clostridium sporogenes]MCF4017975.1 hypothetical protein [Clostridium sporogenes]MCW6061689.1 hypothetical protein [Clostridium sporogenes]MCW6067533.1 hypothetical protein [Clostridium sporogenes]
MKRGGLLSVFRLIAISMFIMAAMLLFLMINNLHNMMTDKDLELKDSANLRV